MRLKEWEEKFDKNEKLEEEKEQLKIQKLLYKEQEQQRLKEQEDRTINQELTSRLENFDVKQTKNN